MARLDFAIWDGFYERHMATAPTADLLEQLFREATLGDELGYHSYFVIEHQNSHISHITSPSIYLAPVAQRTRRLRLGAMLYVFPFHAARARGALLDHRCGRRGGEKCEIYRQAWRRHGHHGLMPRMFLMRYVHVAATDAQAEAGAKEHLLTARDGGDWLHKTRVGFKRVQYPHHSGATARLPGHTQLL